MSSAPATGRTGSEALAARPEQGSPRMTRYLLTFPSSAMKVADSEWSDVAASAHAVMREARDAGVYVFSGGLNDTVAPVRVADDGTVVPGTNPETSQLDGGFAVL